MCNISIDTMYLLLKALETAMLTPGDMTMRKLASAACVDLIREVRRQPCPALALDTMYARGMLP